MNRLHDNKSVCPVPGCPREKLHRHAMCGQHWSLVPKHLQDKIYATAKDHAWVSWKGHLDAAVKEVQEALSAKA